jgi:hypothetical protein
MAYATIADLQSYNGNIDVSDPVETERLLERASEWVDSVITRPITTTSAEAVKNATLAIVEAYAAGTEINEIVGAAGGGFSIGSFSMDKDASAGTALPVRAVRYLRRAGLMNSRVGWY